MKFTAFLATLGTIGATLMGTQALATQTVSCRAQTPELFTVRFNMGAEASISWLVAQGDGPTDSVRYGNITDSEFPTRLFPANSQLVHSWSTEESLKYRFFDLDLIKNVLELNLLKAGDSLVGTVSWHGGEPMPVLCN
jgi:hypothetical protein